jgi:hypothetical protein
MMILNGYIACICEGSAEKAIIELLLDNDKLSFNRTQLLDEEILPCRSAKDFEAKYLRKRFPEKITVLRVLDSRRENFKLSTLYKDKVKVVNVITAPEIEVLIIINEKKYKDYEKTKLKPSAYCKRYLKYKNVKHYSFVKSYFSNIDVLLSVISEYKRISKIQKNEYALWDLLKTI